MRIIDQQDRKRIILEPGEYYVTRESVDLSTLLGSCVSVCLYDPVRKVAGMNHFLLGNKRYSRELPVCLSEAGRYGIHSMELLINRMMELGANRKAILAKAFGGGSVLPKAVEHGNFRCVGDVNVKFVREFLNKENIPLVAEELGGDQGRVIHFQPHSYSVYVRPIRGITNEAIARRDQAWWSKTITLQNSREARPVVWP